MPFSELPAARLSLYQLAALVQAGMDNFLNTQLHPADTCNICTEHFSATHQPAALPCKHIFGHECIKKWLKEGRGNSNACPTCRYVVVPKPNPRATFDVASIWKAICDQPPERLHEFMMKIWSGLEILWQREPTGAFTTTSILDQAIIPALINTAHRTNAPDDRRPDSLLDCYNLVAASWDSLGRPDIATGLAIPLVRLARLMASAGAVLPKWMTTNPRANRLVWRANACLPIGEVDISWRYIIEASQQIESPYFPFLHLYTMFISQSIAHFPAPRPYPTKRHEIMNLVVERCCTKIGGGGAAWKGKPGDELKEVLVGVYDELQRHQLKKNRMSLRGHDGEDALVKGIWALAGWGGGRGNAR
ncbi:uncharacterized protein J4E84_000204 [Alternaria hordeiaustralica]|uniref:uncharacterized protein n=1 Tax=Alternaria hordeiaustralica TaxID=1187925 RepID=UPI0020C27596|nr:uncharacterized protein J4E84_000204 [Alternaria hordeiaustralica]KAI4697079.1 hypothetical protein J4E84_000204 [Alternaria hordeiaustralica]